MSVDVADEGAVKGQGRNEGAVDAAVTVYIERAMDTAVTVYTEGMSTQQ